MSRILSHVSAVNRFRHKIRGPISIERVLLNLGISSVFALGVLFPAACGSTSSNKMQDPVLWSAGMETGDLSEWFLPASGPSNNNGGDIENSGVAAAVASTDVAHSGMFSAKMTITTPNDPVSGVRLFRWLEPRTHADLYYRIWYYFPKVYAPADSSSWWNVLQWKSEHVVNGQTVSDPFYVLGVGETSQNGIPAMYLYLCPPGATIGGPMCLSQQAPFTFVPVGQWFEVEAHYVCAGDNTGRITIWQGGATTPLFDVPGTQTRYADGDCVWSVNNYSDGLNPASSTIYVDDVAICDGGRCPQK